MDDSEPTLAQRTKAEAAWQRLAAPLSAIREIREVVLFAVLSSDDPTQQQQDLLRDICKIESRLLKRCLASHRIRTLDLLQLDQQDSWQEICDYLKSIRQMRQAAEIYDFGLRAKGILEKIAIDLE